MDHHAHHPVRKHFDDALEKLREHVDKLEEQFEYVVASEADACDARVRAIQSEMTLVTEAKTAGEKKQEDLEIECSRLRRGEASLLEDIERLRTEKTASEAREKEIASDMASLDAENKEFKKVSRVVALENENTKSVAEIQRLEKVVDKYRARVAQMKQQLRQATTTTDKQKQVDGDS